jgi:hypothetical protein
MDSLRRCILCNTDKPDSDFHHWGTVSPPVCKPCYRVRGNKYHAKISARNKVIFGVAHYPNHNLTAKIRLSTMRERAISVYGGVCSCCGESDSRVLAFDHIHGGGRQDPNKGCTFYTRVIAAGYPNDVYRLLCWNCNYSYGRYGYCPHRDSPIVVSGMQVARHARLKAEMIAAYGGKCSVCGESHPEFLSLGRWHNDDPEAARQAKRAGFYYWVRRQGWPQNGYRLFCFNCNTIRSIGDERTWGNDTLAQLRDTLKREPWRKRELEKQIKNLLRK